MFVGNFIEVCDNSGILDGRCISIFRRPYAEIGGLVSIVANRRKSVRKTVKKNTAEGVVLLTNGKNTRSFGDYAFGFDMLRVALFNNDRDDFLGTKVAAPVTLEIYQETPIRVLGLMSDAFNTRLFSLLEPVLRFFKCVV